MSVEEFAERRGHLEAWLDRLLAAERTQPGDVVIRDRIGKRRGSILVYLYEPAAEPTNNRAERELRSAVVARKMSCRNQTEAGQRSFEVLRSVVTTTSPPSPVCCRWVPAPTRCRRRWWPSEPPCVSSRGPAGAGTVRVCLPAKHEHGYNPFGCYFAQLKENGTFSLPEEPVLPKFVKVDKVAAKRVEPISNEQTGRTSFAGAHMTDFPPISGDFPPLNLNQARSEARTAVIGE
jgi:hypothetical protein